ncbi:Catechol 2,3-dioxygenase [Aliiroseovarius halocynthiae]|uniref:VOC family protein n=1 Tax=Aliiroseovarius halocynthiae TaxID=985055 RepID=A0A545SMV2_9RHOB|nr:VOC family protein [Aliiroseovarius halocynthiae]TQV66332.1 VOC family protein [Aliiroseovarius halocynthiae]SMR83304.1 Catechol 2,3-dioxygenase [Aliiroseovarius halocynthiae]
MQKVDGIGGLFFRAHDPAGLAAWYEQHLGINPVPTSAEGTPWTQNAGATVFAPFPADTEYFGASDQAFMINFRVSDLDAMIVQLKGQGVQIASREDMDGVGRFARIHDPEGNPIELWEPVA